MKGIKKIIFILVLFAVFCSGNVVDVAAFKSGEYYLPGSPIQTEKAYIGDTFGNDQQNWVSTAPEIGDYDYSLAIMGDIQIVNNYYPEDFPKLFDYIIDNAEERNTRFCLTMGDLTDKDKIEEWERCKTQFNRIGEVMPYTLIRGNHDGRARMEETFGGNSAYKSMMDGFFMDQISIGYTTFSVGVHKFLVLTLDWFVDEIHLKWAGSIIEAHPDYNVIITVHNFLDKSGVPSSASSAFTQSSYTNNLDMYNTPHSQNKSLNGIDIWFDLASQYPNVKLILSGHIASDKILMWTGKGVHGNTVTALLVNPQDLDASTPYLPGNWYFPIGSGGYQAGFTDGYNGKGAGIITTLYISNEGRAFVEHYSTIQKKWFKASNQFEFKLDLISINDTNPTGSKYTQVVGA